MTNRVVEIDSKSGFCFGVVKAIEKAEASLLKHKEIKSLGDIVHNDSEVHRLENKGLVTVDHSQIGNLKGKNLLIRAHGEPPSTYQQAKEAGVNIIDATCPVVIKLQNRVKAAYQKAQSINGTILIYGKKNHAEVNGLVGQTNGEALVIESANDLEGVNFEKPLFLFSQTTQSIESFNNLVALIQSRIKETDLLEYHDTICRQVSNRVPHIKAFAQQFDLILFVGGIKSSNGQVLYNSCKQVNSNSYFVTKASEVESSWFSETIQSVGVCGATSTPLWLMEEVATRVRKDF